MKDDDTHIQKNSNNVTSKKTLYSLYELLIEGFSLSIPICIYFGNKFYKTSSVPEEVLSAKIQLNELQNSNMKIINNIEVMKYKKTIKNGFNAFINNNYQNLYSNFYYIEDVQNKILNSNTFIKKLYKFILNSKSENNKLIIYINNILFTEEDSCNTFTEFIELLKNKLYYNTQNNLIENIENTKNTKTKILFKKISNINTILNNNEIINKCNISNKKDIYSMKTAIFKRQLI